MNKSAKRVTCLLLSALTAFSFVGCGDDEGNGGVEKRDRETDQVVFATEALDGNFNPFFATSAPDSEMASMTQVGMLTTDKNGNVVCGDDQPTVVLSYTEKPVNEGGKRYTDYSFVIKNGIKFSDGKDLTIKDVLFNLYVYLDPAYMGSATLYSTDIVGLKSYRAQDDSVGDTTTADMETTFKTKADERFKRLTDYLEGKGSLSTEIEQDIATTKKFFKKEVETDWTTCQGTIENYEDDYTFTEDWQIFYFYEGVISKWVDDAIMPDGYMDTNNKYITNITEPNSVQYKVGEQTVTYTGNYYSSHIAESVANTDDIKTAAIDYVYTANMGTEDVLNKQGMLEVLNYWKTGTEVYNDFVADARTDWFNETGMKVPTISGITTGKTTVGSEEHDVLKIRINGVDPKAIYNFAFAVAPMHYYSGKYAGKDYVKESLDELKTDVDVYTEFGVKFSDKGFFDQVLQHEDKNKKPVGAGVYKVSNQNGDTENVSGNDFFSNGWVYFTRNDYFDTVGGDAIYNAKIKYLSYREVNSDKLLQALQAKNIDIGEPNATAENIGAIRDSGHLAQRTVPTNGYGYVGINPKFVPDIEVRQAIMYAMDTAECIKYYSENASQLFRAMSKESWIWDKLPQSSYPELYTSKYPFAGANPEIITRLVEGAGWKKDGGVYKKDGKSLELTFTIAGSTTDHPAYQMFARARDLLNSLGFKVTVATDPSALKSLATGNLAVWAAAWSSTVDPDMYQVYHKDSKATSVNNWGYSTIYANLNDTNFAYERGVIDALSVKIEEGRETTNQDERAKIYAEALNMVMDLAVELPTYQRNDCVCYNKEVINASSLNSDPTAFAGVIDKIWELDYN